MMTMIMMMKLTLSVPSSADVNNASSSTSTPSPQSVFMEHCLNTLIAIHLLPSIIIDSMEKKLPNPVVTQLEEPFTAPEGSVPCSQEPHSSLY
jgi:hypothetical protein